MQRAYAYQADPSQFTGRPKLPKYRHKTAGRNLLVFELGAIWKGTLKHREIAVSQLGLIALTRVQPPQVEQVRMVPKEGCYVVEVIYTAEETPAQVDQQLFVAIEPRGQRAGDPDE